MEGGMWQRELQSLPDSLRLRLDHIIDLRCESWASDYPHFVWCKYSRMCPRAVWVECLLLEGAAVALHPGLYGSSNLMENRFLIIISDRYYKATANDHIHTFPSQNTPAPADFSLWGPYLSMIRLKNHSNKTLCWIPVNAGKSFLLTYI